ncbi:hypothetical protein AG1IA_06190 [Rhizoctonia solani AG-1 IA]|uniref:Uncharacterized protein n=1 Tax=Thanatephorus cucumeris (strain AG1-IA) TaxID=983506 RepID=L8WSM9_THACA|nr:hypothetical protein AG1IA_06190 [Rhizoctonia solani AG-1 IA]
MYIGRPLVNPKVAVRQLERREKTQGLRSWSQCDVYDAHIVANYPRFRLHPRCSGTTYCSATTLRESHQSLCARITAKFCSQPGFTLPVMITIETMVIQIYFLFRCWSIMSKRKWAFAPLAVATDYRPDLHSTSGELGRIIILPGPYHDYNNNGLPDSTTTRRERAANKLKETTQMELGLAAASSGSSLGRSSG